MGWHLSWHSCLPFVQQVDKISRFSPPSRLFSRQIRFFYICSFKKENRRDFKFLMTNFLIFPNIRANLRKYRNYSMANIQRAILRDVIWRCKVPAFEKTLRNSALSFVNSLRLCKKSETSFHKSFLTYRLGAYRFLREKKNLKYVRLPSVFKWIILLKGQKHEIFDLWFFHKSVVPGPLIHTPNISVICCFFEL